MYDKQVVQLVENLDKAKQVLLKAHVKTPRALVDWMERSCLPYLKLQLKEATGDYKKVINTLLNSTQSLYEGFTDGAADFDDAADLGREYRGAVAAIEVIKDREDTKLTPEQKEADRAKGRDTFFKMTQESEPVIRKYSVWKDDVPRNLFRKPFEIKRLPVIPLTDPQLNFEKLKKGKLATDHISFYPIILNQPVLGISNEWILSEFKGKSQDALEYVLDAAKDKFGKTHHAMGLANHIGLVTWFWIPSDKDIARIQMASPGGRLAIKKWGFPF